jgi:hypothetical protein
MTAENTLTGISGIFEPASVLVHEAVLFRLLQAGDRQLTVMPYSPNRMGRVGSGTLDHNGNFGT